MKYSWFSYLFFTTVSIAAEIIECPHFEDVPSYLTDETICILDIDDTLLIPVQMLGCDEWFQCRFKWYKEQGFDSSAALEKSLAEWEGIRHLTKMEIVENGTEKVIESLQRQGFSVMGLTTQGLALATRTVQQLANCGISLLKTAPAKSDSYFQVLEHGVLFKNGILFTSGTHKGDAFFRFCDSIGYQPKRIVFVNDKASHLEEIEISAEKRGISFVGLRYSYSDARKRAFSPEIADYQFFHSSFNHILSDEEAIEKIEHSFSPLEKE